MSPSPEGTRSSQATWVDVDLDAVRGNVRAALGTGAPAVMAVVKADGYGHGAVPVARAALDAGATWLGVARAQEALALRDAGITAPLLLLGYVPPATVGPLVRAGVSLTVWSDGHVGAAGAAAAPGAAAPVHLKVDTGMTRIGCTPADAPGLARLVRDTPGVRLQGVFTHLARADEVADEGGVRTTTEQLDAFDRVVAELTAAGLRPPLVHAANSAGTLAVPRSHHDLVRFGIALYGLSPGPQVTRPPAIRAALTWTTVLAQVKQVPPGRGVSYGHTYITTATQRIGTLPVGYADGWRRAVTNEVLVRGVRVPVLGRVCMDQCLVDLDGVPEAAVGDEVVLIGDQDGQRITADDVARRWGTIGYEVVCGIGHRVPRMYAP